MLPPAREAELYRALGYIPTVKVDLHAKDIAGQTGIGFILPATPQSVNLEIILVPVTYQYMAQVA